MKRILVPTDFSAIADNALDYAIEIAAEFSAEILVYHVYRFSRRFHVNKNLPEDQQPYIQEIQLKMQATVSRVSEIAVKKGISIKSIVEKNSVFFLFKNKVVEHNIDLIVMGTSGSESAGNLIFGSTAVTALESANAPVLVIPPDYQFKKINRAILAVDLKPILEETLIPFKQLISRFCNKLTVLSVWTAKQQTVDKEFVIEFEDVDTDYHEIKMTSSINRTIGDYVDENNYDLVCMIRREKGFFESLFSKSITEIQVYYTKVPLLVLPAR